jgi:hypothetical protein
MWRVLSSPQHPVQINRFRVPSPDRRRRRGHSLQPGPSIFDGETFPDFIDPLFQGIEPGVKSPLVKAKNVTEGQKSENPVVAFHVNQYLLDRVTDGDSNAQQNIHRLPHSEKMTL